MILDRSSVYHLHYNSLTHPSTHTHTHTHTSVEYSKFRFSSRAALVHLISKFAKNKIPNSFGLDTSSETVSILYQKQVFVIFKSFLIFVHQ